MIAKTAKTKQPPKHLNAAGREYWRQTLAEFEIESELLPMLARACEQLDRCAAARELIAEKGITTTDRFGQIKEAPWVTTERAASIAYLRLRREMGVDLVETESRAPRRTGRR